MVVEPYSRCPHFVAVEHAQVPGGNYSSQQEGAVDEVFVQEEVVDQASVQAEAVDQVPVAEEAVAQIPAHVLESFHRVQHAYQNWLANMSHTVSLFQGRKFDS